MAGAGIHPYHQQWPPAAPPPPPPAAAAPPPILVDNPNRPAADEVFYYFSFPQTKPQTMDRSLILNFLLFPIQVRTIFITGLPEDVKERELQNLLRWLPGYEASQVNLKGEKPMGFALFATGHQALAAKETLQVQHFFFLNVCSWKQIGFDQKRLHFLIEFLDPSSSEHGL